ncbi:hypothetical protein [Niveispirillum fermenti]|uniref:hypothetical protein n=1 Tax=Niveispirillum fermenti TaxID=1233113 RepID=UPI003A8A0524
MLEKLAQAAIAFFIIAGISYLLGTGIAHSVESALRKRQQGVGLEARMQRLGALSQRLQARRQTLLPVLVKLDAKVKSARRRHYMVNKKITDMKIARSQLLRVQGEEDAFLRTERPARKFIAHVVNRHVQRAQMDQKEHPFLSKGWARTQQVVIWASTIGDAKILAERAFPPATGFFVAEISEPQSEGDDMTALENAELAAALSERVTG